MVACQGLQSGSVRSLDGMTMGRTSLLSTKARKNHSDKLRLDSWLRRFEVHAPHSLNNKGVDR